MDRKVTSYFRKWLNMARLREMSYTVVLALYVAVVKKKSNRFWKVMREDNGAFYIWAPKARTALLVKTPIGKSHLERLIVERFCEKDVLGKYESMYDWYHRMESEDPDNL